MAKCHENRKRRKRRQKMRTKQFRRHVDIYLRYQRGELPFTEVSRSVVFLSRNRMLVIDFDWWCHTIVNCGKVIWVYGEAIRQFAESVSSVIDRLKVNDPGRRDNT